LAVEACGDTVFSFTCYGDNDFSLGFLGVGIGDVTRTNVDFAALFFERLLYVGGFADNHVFQLLCQLIDVFLVFGFAHFFFKLLAFFGGDDLHVADGSIGITVQQGGTEGGGSCARVVVCCGVGEGDEGGKAEDEAAGEEGQTAIVIALPEATGPAGSAGSAEPVDAVEPLGEKAAHASADTPVEAVPDAVSDTVADTTLEMAAVVDEPGTDTHAEPREPHAEPDTGVKGDEGMAAPGDADGGTEVETTDTPEPLLVS